MGFLSDLGNVVSSGIGAVGDAIEGAVDAVTGAVGGALGGLFGGIQGLFGRLNNLLCRNTGSIGCRIGNVILGGLSGLVEGIRDIIDRFLGLIQTIGGALGALLRGDIAGFLGQLGKFFIELVLTIIDAIRVVALGTVIGGIRDAWEAENLRQFVEDLLKQKFGADPPRLATIRESLNLDSTSWGFEMGVTHKVFRLDSATAPLWQWHQQGLIDLYAMAGLISFDSFNIRRGRTLVRSVDGATESSFAISRWKLAHYIDSNGADGHIRVYALAIPAIREFVSVTTAKFKKLAINLTFDQEALPLPYPTILTHDISTKEEWNFDRKDLGPYLDRKALRTPDSSQCNMLALAAFRLKAGLGQTSGRAISEGSESEGCTTPGRDDGCCVTVDRDKQAGGAGVIYFDEWPSQFTRYVLAHEGGHYSGLCHFGHDGLQNIMFTPAKDVGLSYFSFGIFLHYYLSNEPSFSLKDAKNIWRFLLTEMSDCLDGRPIDQPTEPIVL